MLFILPWVGSCLYISYCKVIPNYITNITCMGHRVYATDVQESFHFIRYKRQENQLIVFADDTHPRWITAACKLDYNTMAGADKFGNITVVSIGFFIHRNRKLDW